MGDATIPANVSVFAIAATSATSSSQPPSRLKQVSTGDELRHLNACESTLVYVSSCRTKVNVIEHYRRNDLQLLHRVKIGKLYIFFFFESISK